MESVPNLPAGPLLQARGPARPRAARALCLLVAVSASVRAYADAPNPSAVGDTQGLLPHVLAGTGIESCFPAVAAKYHLEESLLRAVAKIESAYQTRAVHYDNDGTHDVGVMQINSSHFAELSQYHITEDTLLNRPCTNIAVGASILKGFVSRFGMTWRAIGSYGAGTSPNKEAARIAYANLVSHALQGQASPAPRILTKASLPVGATLTSTEVADGRPNRSMSGASATPSVPHMVVFE